MKPLLLAAGYVNLDITAELSRVPTFGERVTAESISRSPGGMTANMACAASRLGMEVHFFGSIGSDTGGQEAVDELERFGVVTDGIVVTADATTTSLILLGPGGDRAVVSEPLTFDYGPLRRALVGQTERARVLHVDGYRLPEALPVLREARTAGFVVSADLDGIESPDLRSMLPEIGKVLDLAFLNRRVAQSISADPEEVARQFVDRGVIAVAVTLGEEGALVSDGESLHIPAPAVDVTDTTGAGDAFAAAFLSEWMEDRNVERAGSFAVAESATSVKGTGARGSLPDRRNVEQSKASGESGTEELVERRGTR